VIGNILVGVHKPELFKDVPHDRARHDDVKVIPFAQPASDKCLSISFILFPRNNVMEIQLPALFKFKPPPRAFPISLPESTRILSIRLSLQLCDPDVFKIRGIWFRFPQSESDIFGEILGFYPSNKSLTLCPLTDSHRCLYLQWLQGAFSGRTGICPSFIDRSAWIALTTALRSLG